MADLNETPVWENGIYQFEQTDVVQGGPTGIDNRPTGQLANRTGFLKRAAEGYYNVVSFNASHTFTPTEVLHNFIVIDAISASLSFVLPRAADLFIGAKVIIQAINVNHGQVSLLGSTGDDIILFDIAGPIFLGNGDTVQLVLTPFGWLVHQYHGNFLDVGNILYQYKQIQNTVIANGQVLNRLEYPRLWEYAQTLGGSLISDISWTGNSINHGFFSIGNGSTTFRVPDLRGMFIRGLDLGAGVDFGRTNENPGGYEADEIKSHDHDQQLTRTDQVGDRIEVNHMDSGSGRGLFVQIVKTGKTGGLETRVKNIGLLPLIKI
jgi:hypothetical protein